MKVKATRLGYYGLERVREGQVFEIANEAHFSKRWMEKVEEEVAPEPVKAAPAKSAAKVPPVPPHVVPAAPTAARPAGQPTGAAAVI